MKKGSSLKIEHKRGIGVNSYVFQIKLERDDNGWRAFYPALEDIGASTWGKTQKEALKNIQEVLAMIVEEFKEEGRSIPASEHMKVSEGAFIAVNI